jgi:exopolyphosphatase/guanosine-5'-triphosphate,3'-diphosphate pyrophosphatase
VQDLVGSSGTFEALILATSLQQEAGSFSSSGMGVDRESLLSLVDQLLGMTRAERAEVPGIDAKRADQIVAGALLVRHVLHHIPTIRRIRLSKEALREGMVAHYIARKSDQIANLGRIGGVRRRSVFEMAIRYDWDEVHAQQVANFALELFDALVMLHRLGDRERELLEYAGLLHDVGYHISRSGHHKHALYLIQNGELRGFTPEEVQIVAHVARYHRKSLPKPTHASFYDMSASAQKTTLHLAAILRIAEGLDRSRFQHIHITSVTVDPADIYIRIKGVHDVQLDIWGALRWKDLMEILYKRSLHVEQNPD